RRVPRVPHGRVPFTGIHGRVPPSVPREDRRGPGGRSRGWDRARRDADGARRAVGAKRAVPQREHGACPAPGGGSRVRRVSVPETRYAKSGDVHLAYQVVGDGALDLVYVPGFASNVEEAWEDPHYDRFLRRLASFARLILFDKRGTGLSD